MESPQAKLKLLLGRQRLYLPSEREVAAVAAAHGKSRKPKGAVVHTNHDHTGATDERLSRCDCCCPPLFGSLCLLPPYLLYTVTIPCICGGLSASGRLKMGCDLFCHSTGLPPVPPPITGGGGVIIINPSNPICDDGPGDAYYHCIECVNGQVVNGYDDAHLQPACHNYCCCYWSADPDNSTGLCAVGATDPCIDGVALGCAGGQQSVVRCQHGPARTVACGFLGSVSIRNYHTCSGPCFNSGISDSLYIVNFRANCNHGQGDLVGCNEKEHCNPGDADTVTDPLTGRCRKKLHIHLVSDASFPAGCGMDDVNGQACYMDISEP